LASPVSQKWLCLQAAAHEPLQAKLGVTPAWLCRANLLYKEKVSYFDVSSRRACFFFPKYKLAAIKEEAHAHHGDMAIAG